VTELAQLTAEDFPAFLHAVHGRDPFPWQAELVRQVLREGRWPDLIDVPTGLGKTTMIDVAVFVAAATATQTGGLRVGRRRCFFVVDRRLVVDEAEQHATDLAQALGLAEQSGRTDVVGVVAAHLRSYAPDAGGEVLPVTKMRGGATWAADWLDRPDRPGIVLGTVDQVGSRLLFRGYGVSDRRKPIDAALVGTDALLMVDEAHLSTALLTTVEAAQHRDRLGIPLPGLAVTRLSATGAAAARPFVLDEQSHRHNDEAWRRLTAAKRLMPMTATAKDCVKVIAQATLDELSRLAGHAADGIAPAVLVVCNTVDRARDVHSHLVKHFQKAKTAGTMDCELLIGRSRPIDREAHPLSALETLHIGRPGGRPPTVLVATQTVEVGVNIDADGLVTESASWDALVQRLGRLNRLGRFTQRYPGLPAANAMVVHDGQADGPVYGAARDITWATLENAASVAGGIDVSPLACRALTKGPLGAAAARRDATGVPVLLTPTLDTWAQTAPIPLNDPPVAPYLHGFDSGRAPVQVLWRDGLLTGDALDDPFDDGGAEAGVAAVSVLLAQFPPRTAETVEVPWHAVRQWMLGQAADAVSDLEAEPEPAASRVTTIREPFRVLAQRPARRAASPAGSDSDREWQWTWITAEQLRPADQIIVPAERGGLDQYGWAPRRQSTVADVSEPAAFLTQRGRRPAMLRLDAGLAGRLHLDGEARDVLRQLAGSPDPRTDDITDDQIPVGSQQWHALAGELARHLPPEPPPGSGWPLEAWERLRHWWEGGKLTVVSILDSTDPFADRSPKVAGRLLAGPLDPTSTHVDPERDDEEAAASSVSPRTVTLEQHHAAVRERSRQIAAALRLPEDLRRVIEDAAGWHDLGKTDERFQIMLYGGDRIEALVATEILAKSGLDPNDRQAWRRSARLSGLPPGARHEAWSAALVAGHLHDHPHPGDTDLLIHLIAAHHGYARPHARLVVDPEPRTIVTDIDGHKTTTTSDQTVDLTQPTRFAQLNDRYGRWGLALLETVVRCADMTVSEEGS
jgi:CRISPR-associated endonuclease/helicase Cas3